MSTSRQRLSMVAQLIGMAAAFGAFDDVEVPAVVPADPEHPGPVRIDGVEYHCCYAQWMIGPGTHNADCGGAVEGQATTGAGAPKGEQR